MIKNVYNYYIEMTVCKMLFMWGKTLANTHTLLTCFDQFITNMLAFHCELNILTCWYARGNPLQNPRGKISLNYVQRSSSSFIHHKFLKWHSSFLSCFLSSSNFLHSTFSHYLTKNKLESFNIVIKTLFAY